MKIRVCSLLGIKYINSVYFEKNRIVHFDKQQDRTQYILKRKPPILFFMNFVHKDDRTKYILKRNENNRSCYLFPYPF